MKLRWRDAAGGVAGLLVALGLALPGAAASLVNRPAPEFVRTDLQHQRIDLVAYRGRVVLLTFWATWCAPCQLEIPHLIAWQRRYSSAGLQVIAISMDDDATPVLRLMQKRGVNYPVILGDAKLGELYGGVLGLPLTYLIDRNGTVVARFAGETSIETLRRGVEGMLARR